MSNDKKTVSQAPKPQTTQSNPPTASYGTKATRDSNSQSAKPVAPTASYGTKTVSQSNGSVAPVRPTSSYGTERIRNSEGIKTIRLTEPKR